ncbi:MAG: hypothetical protein KF781_06735 [Chitinophagaceae bacterium]|nr:hypothetical protein [Chitinophagaceae bacterium]MCW5904083.1 hypothetical protein [Chitinophagaceae bacterium]
MRILRTILFAVIITVTLSSCNFFRNIFGGGNKNGCPSNGKNVGAERLMQDEGGKGKKKGKTPKAPKYKLDKFR